MHKMVDRFPSRKKIRKQYVCGCLQTIHIEKKFSGQKTNTVFQLGSFRVLRARAVVTVGNSGQKVIVVPPPTHPAA